jgi:hypothetical protein
MCGGHVDDSVGPRYTAGMGARSTVGLSWLLVATGCGDAPATTTSATSSAAPASTAANDDDCKPVGSQQPISVSTNPMKPICAGVFAEAEIDDAGVAKLRQAREDARRDLRRAFGTLEGAPPVTYFCRTAICKQAFGVGAGPAASEDLGFTRDEIHTDDGVRVEPSVVVTGPVEGTTRILLHEMVHVEMKAYAPYDAVPTWFNEGVATMIAREPKCSAEVLEKVAAPGAFDVKTLVSKQDWQSHLQTTNATIETYCGSRVAVESWARGFDGPEGVAAALKSVLARVAAGGGFDLGG